MEPVHIRDIKTEVFLLGETEVLLKGTLTDNRPRGMHGTGNQPVMIHDIELDLKVSIPDLVIKEVKASMNEVPHPECRQVLDSLKRLEGLAISGGFNKKVSELFPRTRACLHFKALITAMAPMAMQGMFVNFVGKAGEKILEGGDEAEKLMEMSFDWWKNTCFVSAEDGPIVAKMKEKGMFYSLKEVAGMLNVEYKEMEDMANRGDVPAVESAGVWAVRFEALSPWFAERRKEREALGGNQ
jgi:hypothetical protein